MFEIILGLIIIGIIWKFIDEDTKDNVRKEVNHLDKSINGFATILCIKTEIEKDITSVKCKIELLDLSLNYSQTDTGHFNFPNDISLMLKLKEKEILSQKLELLKKELKEFMKTRNNRSTASLCRMNNIQVEQEIKDKLQVLKDIELEFFHIKRMRRKDYITEEQYFLAFQRIQEKLDLL